MLNDKPGAAPQESPAESADSPADMDGPDNDYSSKSPAFEESLVDELGALIDDGRTYAEAELAFQKTRAALAGKSIALAVVFAIVAVILLHIAFLAFAVGMVIALQTLIGIWGAIAVVVGVLLLATGLLGYAAARQGKLIGAMFASEKGSEDS